MESLETLIIVVVIISLVMIAYMTLTGVLEYYGNKINEDVYSQMRKADYKIIFPEPGTKLPVFYDKNSSEAWFYIKVASTMDKLDEINALPINIQDIPVDGVEIVKEGTININGVLYTLYNVKVKINMNEYKGGLLKVSVKNSYTTIIGVMTPVQLSLIYPINGGIVYTLRTPIKIKNTGEKTVIHSIGVWVGDTKINTIYINNNVVSNPDNLNITLDTNDVLTFYVDFGMFTEGIYNLSVKINDQMFRVTIFVKEPPKLTITNIKLDKEITEEGLKFTFNIDLYNNDTKSIILTKSNTKVIINGKEYPVILPNGQNIVRLFTKQSVRIQTVVYNISPGEVYVSVEKDNYETNRVPVTIPVVKGIWLYSSKIYVNILNLTIKNMGNVYFRISNVKVFINNKEVKILKTIPIGSSVDVGETFNISVDVTGFVPNKKYPIKIKVNDMEYNGNILIPIDRHFIIVGVNTTETYVDFKLKYVANYELRCEDWNILVSVLNSTTPLIYTICDSTSSCNSNVKPILSFKLKGTTNTTGVLRIKPNDYIKVRAPIPFPLAGKYFVNISTDDIIDKKPVYGYGYELMFSVIKDVTQKSLSIDSNVLNNEYNVIPMLYFDSRMLEPNRYYIKLLYGGTSIDKKIVTRIIKKLPDNTYITSAYIHNIPLYIESNNISYPIVRDVDVISYRELPGILSSKKINDITNYYHYTSNGSYSNMIMVNVNYSSLKNVAIKIERINIESSSINYYREIPREVIQFVPDHYNYYYNKLMIIPEPTLLPINTKNVGILWLNVLPRIIHNGTGTIRINSPVYNVINYVTLPSTIYYVSILNESPSITSTGSVDISTTSFIIESYSVNPYILWEFDEMKTSHTSKYIGIPSIEPLRWTTTNVHNTISFIPPSLILNTTDQPLLLRVYIHSFDIHNDKDYKESENLIMYYDPIQRVIGNIKFSSLSTDNGFVASKEKGISYEYRDLRQLTFYIVNLYSAKIPYELMEPNNYTILNKVNILLTEPLPSPVDVRRKYLIGVNSNDVFQTSNMVSNPENIMSSHEVIPFITPALRSYYIYNAILYYTHIPEVFEWHTIGNGTSMPIYRLNLEDMSLINSSIILTNVNVNKTFVSNVLVYTYQPSINSFTISQHPYLVSIMYVQTTHSTNIPLYLIKIPFRFISSNTGLVTENGTKILLNRVNSSYVSITGVYGKMFSIRLNEEIYNKMSSLGEVDKIINDKSESNITMNYEDITGVIVRSTTYSIIVFKVGDKPIMSIVPTVFLFHIPYSVSSSSISNFIVKGVSTGTIYFDYTLINETQNTKYLVSELISSNVNNLITITQPSLLKWSVSVKNINYITYQLLDPVTSYVTMLELSGIKVYSEPSVIIEYYGLPYYSSHIND